MGWFGRLVLAARRDLRLARFPEPVTEAGAKLRPSNLPHPRRDPQDLLEGHAATLRLECLRLPQTIINARTKATEASSEAMVRTWFHHVQSLR